MAKAKKALTKAQRAALKPLVKNLGTAFKDLDRAVANVRRQAGEEFGFCFRCPKPGRQELCSSFLGPGKSMGERCRREFCGHPLMFHF
jgi:hypothetical protein